MKTKAIILFAISAIASWSVQAQEPISSGEKLTLSECIKTANQNSINIKRAQIQRIISAIDLREAKHQFLPQVSAGISQGFDFGRSRDNRGVYVDRSSASTSFSIGGNFNLFSGLARLHAIKEGKLGKEIANLDEEKVRNDLNLLIAGFFYTAAYKQEVCKIIQLQKEQTDKKVKQTETMVKAGKWDESRLYDMQAEQAQNELDLTQAKAELSQAMLDLTQAMNIEESYSQRAIDTEGLEHQPVKDILPTSPSSIYQAATIWMPQIQAAKLQIEKSKEQISGAKSGYLPSLGLSVGYNNGYYYNFQKEYKAFNKSFADQWKENGRTGISLSLNIPIFDALQTKERVNRAKASQTLAMLDLTDREQSLRKDVEQAFNNAKNAKQQIVVADLSLKAAEKAFKAAEYRYEAGKITAYEYNEAANKLSIAKVKLLQAKFDYIYKEYTLKFYINPKMSSDNLGGHH